MNKPRGRPFEPGNQFGRGRPRGSKNKRTVAQATLEQFAEPLIKKSVAQALEGDASMLRFLADRLLPASGERAVRMKIPSLDQIQGVEQIQQKIIEQVTSGKITASDAEKLHAMLQNHRDNIENRETQSRLAEVEKIARQVQAQSQQT